MALPVRYDLSGPSLKRERGRYSTLNDFLAFLSFDQPVFEDDFWGDLFKGGAAPGIYQSTASGAAAATAAIDTGTVNGQIKLDAGTDNNGRTDLSLGRHFRGDYNAVIAVRLRADVITTLKVEVGFTDVLSGTDAGAVNVKATPTFTADDFVGWVLDTADNAYWEGLGVAATVAGTTVEAAISPTAATFETLVVALRDGNAKFLRFDADGGLTYESDWSASMITATVLLTPWVFVQNRNASGHIVNVDFIKVWQRRTSA